MITLIEFEKRRLLFDNPLDVICCNNLTDVRDSFDKIERALQSGHYLAGFISYEAGYAFEECLQNKQNFDFPLVLMGTYKAPKNKEKEKEKAKVQVQEKVQVNEINITKSEYFNDIEKIRKYIAAGDVYQITYCIKFKFDFNGKPSFLYNRLKKEQPVPYPAYIETDDFSILSLSPEMFIKKRGENIVTKPMKGTWPKGSNFFEDLWAGRKLHKDPKNRAENVMIADLLRNDLGRIGRGIRAPKLFEVARYATLYQMTSTVTGKINKYIPIYDVFKALHPSGSVTGAPKIRAMEIIREIEREERKIYTGAIGYITPERDMFFNVPIRTLLIKDGKGEMGVGGGIVWDSTPQGEFDEGMLKAKFLLDMETKS